jgi:hypothetical protein
MRQPPGQREQLSLTAVPVSNSGCRDRGCRVDVDRTHQVPARIAEMPLLWVNRLWVQDEVYTMPARAVKSWQPRHLAELVLTPGASCDHH